MAKEKKEHNNDIEIDTSEQPLIKESALLVTKNEPTYERTTNGFLAVEFEGVVLLFDKDKKFITQLQNFKLQFASESIFEDGRYEIAYYNIVPLRASEIVEMANSARYQHIEIK